MEASEPASGHDTPEVFLSFPSRRLGTRNQVGQALPAVKTSICEICGFCCYLAATAALVAAAPRYDVWNVFRGNNGLGFTSVTANPPAVPE